MQDAGEHRHPINVRAVAAVQVFQDELVSVSRNASVEGRDAVVGKDRPATLVAAEDQLVLGDADLAAGRPGGPGQHADPAQLGPWKRDHGTVVLGGVRMRLAHCLPPGANATGLAVQYVAGNSFRALTRMAASCGQAWTQAGMPPILLHRSHTTARCVTIFSTTSSATDSSTSTGKSFGFFTSSRRSWKRISPPLAGGLTWAAITFLPERKKSVAGGLFGAGGASAFAAGAAFPAAFAGAAGFSGNGGTEYSCRPRLTRSSSFSSWPLSQR